MATKAKLGKSLGGGSPSKPKPKPKPKPAPKKPAPAPAPPAAPAAISPFMTGDDLLQLNSFSTDYASQLANIDFTLGALETETAYQTGQVNSAAKQNTSNTQDDAAARGIFQSSIKDAAVYDIEAQRSLQTKFLNDKLTAGRLNAGTQKNILGNSKAAFDKAMAQKKAENAQGVNDAASAAWAESAAAYGAAHPASTKNGNGTTPGPGAPPKGVSRPSAPATGNQAAYQAAQSQARNAQRAAVEAARARKRKGR